MTGFEAQVRKQIERLNRMPLADIDAQVSAKRRAWLASRSLPARPVTPRAAFDLLFFDYMGLQPEDLPIVEENEREIVWLSQNPCPTLAACTRLGLDTRTVCRYAYEGSTQAFLTVLDPNLRFLRDYHQIRPHAPHCLERIRWGML